ncbi:hypothetical protein KUTeg_024167 [Tegillarca granosa]|uniref:Uncharacterized protein n=1 Tax=Tegillarca granosa TaxID=220873 RepID=A0ABQ9DWK0_TEGGR|nr:hypothetical protein KUTeg_024167 [Tegillarca granosa]
MTIKYIRFKTMSYYSQFYFNELQDFSVDLFLRQSWVDPRLKYTHLEIEKLELGTKMMDFVWIPDTFFVNEKDASFHVVTVPNKLMFLHHDGSIFYSLRCVPFDIDTFVHKGLKISLTFSCYMKLLNFPLDTQNCPIRMENGYTKENVLLNWNSSSPLVVPDYIDVNFTCLEATLHLERNRGFYILQIFVPSILIVMLSWVSFWIDIDAVPARVSLGLMTVLTMTTHTSGTHAMLPRVSYVKAIDIWMATCISFVFGSLLEFAYINVMSRKLRRQQCSNNPTSVILNQVSKLTKQTTYLLNRWAVPSSLIMYKDFRERARKADKFSRVAFPDYSVDMYFRQTWEDPRLKFNHPGIVKLELDNKMISRVWVPDTYFSNEKEARFHDVTVPNRLLFIYNNGTVRYNGMFACLKTELLLVRSRGYYIVQIFVPSILVVVLSWVSFWIDIDAVPARISLGLLTVLAMTTQSSGVRATLPRVSYIKAIDIWMATCITFIFGSLLEFAYINVQNRKINGPKSPTSMVLAEVIQLGKYKQFNYPTIVASPIMQYRSFRDRARRVDKFSRIVFPVCFLDFSISIFLRQTWIDQRLNFTTISNISQLELDQKLIERVWVPDTYFSNEKRATFHYVTVPNKLLHLYRNGTVFYSKEIFIYLFIYFLFLLGGQFTCIKAEIHLNRNFGYYIVQIFVPSSLIVVLSWVSFWIDVDAVPARTSLGILTVLTMTTQTSGIHASLPRVSYVKAIDLWMAICMVFVFGALLEFAYVNVLSRRYRLYLHGKLNSSGNLPSTVMCSYVGNAKIMQRARLTDKISRVVFPLTFFIFNLVFWVYFLHWKEILSKE